MNKWVKIGFSLAVVLSVTACSSSRMESSKSEVKTMEEKSLYTRLGGNEAITAVVYHLWSVASKDDRINQYFSNTDPKIFAGRLINFLGQSSGGPEKYMGKNMKDAHYGMQLTEAHFNALAQDIVITLEHFKVPEKEKNEVMTLLASLKKDIVEK